MATARERDRCRERLERLSESGLDCDSLRREAVADLQRVIGFERWCWPLADPETLLPASGLALHDYVPAVPRSLELEYSTDVFAAKHVLARRANAAASMSAETGGDLARSARWDEAMRPVGIGDVAAVACRDALGCWGWIEAYRDCSDRRGPRMDQLVPRGTDARRVQPAAGRDLPGGRDGAHGDLRRRRARARPSR